MTEQSVATEVDEAYAQLDQITESISTNRGEQRELYEQRKVLFERLLAAGEKQAVIARRAGLTPMAVAYAVGKVQASADAAGKANADD